MNFYNIAYLTCKNHVIQNLLKEVLFKKAYINFMLSYIKHFIEMFTMSNTRSK